MALKKRCLADRIIGVGRSPEKLQRAVELNAIDRWTTDIETVASEADLIYISTPVGMVVDFVSRVVPLAKPGCIITDAGSTKVRICREVAKVAPQGISFIGGHPMAGSEATGVEAGNPDLFVNAAYVLTPYGDVEEEAVEFLSALLKAIGSRVIIMSPEAHDRCVAIISHLPHIMASALVHITKNQENVLPQIVELIAGSFRDMTRVAGSSPELWRDICVSNACEISQAVESLCVEMQKAVHSIVNGDYTSIEGWFKEARDYRQYLMPYINKERE
jgi:prephenate dehydrogenase